MVSELENAFEEAWRGVDEPRCMFISLKCLRWVVEKGGDPGEEVLDFLRSVEDRKEGTVVIVEGGMIALIDE